MTSNFLIYLVIGLLNSGIGYIVILYFTYAGVVAEISNLLGYLLGVVFSYILNKKYNFKSKREHRKELPKFMFSMFISYLVNLIVLVFGYRVFGINVYIAQILAGISYTVTGYTLSKFFVFQERTLSS